MNQWRVLLISVVMFTSLGCSTTGGTIGGLLPAPKFLKGEIKDNRYTSRGNSFSVAVPHEMGSNEYKYMQVKEQYFEKGAYVSFGPAAMDQSIYRLEISIRNTPDSKNIQFDDVVPKVVEAYKEQLKKAYGTALKEEEARRDSINGKKAYYWNYSQVIPAGKISNRADSISHSVYVIDFVKGAAIVWVQNQASTPYSEAKVRQFAESIVMF